jgi:streptomycin 6-kinase
MTPSFKIPEKLREMTASDPGFAVWLEDLPRLIVELRDRWSLELGEPYEGEDVTASWVAPVRREDGSSAVLKIGFPHMEAEHEIAGLRSWDGDPTVRLLEADEPLFSMLIERCEPGSLLRELPEEEQDPIVAQMLERLWREPPQPNLFRPLSEMIAHWIDEIRKGRERRPDPGLVEEGISVFEELIAPPAHVPDVVLATDLHAGNILRAEREPWLVIDPKPFVGDPAYDITQHLLNCDRLQADPLGLIARMCDLTGSDRGRVRLWLFARCAAEERAGWGAQVARELSGGR